MIKALIFDCFGVFYADPVFAYMRDPTTPPKKAEDLHSLDEQGARGILSKKEFILQASKLLGIAPAKVERQFFHSDDRNDVLITFVQELRKSYKVALLSNIGSDMMDGFFLPHERQKLFDEVILSGDTKTIKPDKAIFELTCERLSVRLHEAVMIDDMQTTCDIVKTFGMQSVCYKSFDQCKTELTAIL